MLVVNNYLFELSVCDENDVQPCYDVCSYVLRGHSGRLAVFYRRKAGYKAVPLTGPYKRPFWSVLTDQNTLRVREVSEGRVTTADRLSACSRHLPTRRTAAG